MQALSVSNLNIQIKSILEQTFMSIYIQGEVSSITYHQKSGHIYFSIKDERIDSSIKCVMYKGNARHLRFRLEKGLSIYIKGSISVYPPRGDYQIMAETIDAKGEGNLHLAYEQLKKELGSKGYFDEVHKKPLPVFPKVIGIITSSSGAVIQDIKNVTLKRWPNTKLVLIDTIVQGENAKYNISNNIKYADTLSFDLILVARGGGSLEDLWCFNTKEVADSIFNAKTPIVSAIGHESDTSLSDYVADKRASTPSSAMEIILPDKNYYYEFIMDMSNSFDRSFVNILNKKQKQHSYILDMLKNNSIKLMHKHLRDKLQSIFKAMNNQILYKLNKYNINENHFLMNKLILNKVQTSKQSLSLLKQAYKANNPKLKPKKGQANVSKKDKFVVLSQININDKFTLFDSTAEIQALALDKT